MPRIARLINPGEVTCYHVMSRTALSGLPFGDADNDELLRIIKHFSKIYFAEIVGFCLMGNHQSIAKNVYGGRFPDTKKGRVHPVLCHRGGFFTGRQSVFP